MTNCERCGKAETASRTYENVVDFKGLTLEVEGLKETKCLACGHRFLTEEQDSHNIALLRKAYADRKNKVRQELGLLTGEQIREIIAELNLTQQDAARLFGGGPNAFQKYISGEVLQSAAMDRLVRLTFAFGKKAVEFLELGGAAPLKLNAGGFFISAHPTGNRSARVQDIEPVQTTRSIGTVHSSASSAAAKVEVASA